MTKWRRNRKKTNRADYYGYTPDEVKEFRRLDEFADEGWMPMYAYMDSTEDLGPEPRVPKNPRGQTNMHKRGYRLVNRYNGCDCWERKDLGMTIYLHSTDYRKFIMGVWLHHGLVTATNRFYGRPVKDFIVEIERLAEEGLYVCATCAEVMETPAHKEMAWRFCKECWEGDR